VTPEGQPQTMPIWFIWTDADEGPGEILVYGDRRARRNRNLESNDRVSVHLRESEGGGDIVVIEGRARMDPDVPQVYDNEAYLAKYGAWIDQFLEGAQRMAEVYDVPIRITPTRVVAVG
ncbi:MAG: pyridoxamine 5'-phosphate oxidase family protein, partial [Chloroflexi bacterium]|nr:pyridoxamine 5'-phosphate oxidase family protein [Chloroflexota bacterium]